MDIHFHQVNDWKVQTDFEGATKSLRRTVESADNITIRSLCWKKTTYDIYFLAVKYREQYFFNISVPY